MKTERILQTLKRAQLVTERIAERERLLEADRKELRALLESLEGAHNRHTHAEPRNADFSFFVPDPHWSRAEARQSALHNEAHALLNRSLGATGPIGPPGAIGVTGPVEARADGHVRVFLSHSTADVLEGLQRAQRAAAAEDYTSVPTKYAAILALVAAGDFDVGLAARSIYGEDSDKSRNRVHAGLAHLRSRNVITRTPDGGWAVVRDGLPDESYVAARLR